MITWALTAIAWLIVVAIEFFGLTVPENWPILTEPYFENTAWAIAIILALRAVFWLPFRRHEAQEKKHSETIEKLAEKSREEIKLLEAEIESLRAPTLEIEAIPIDIKSTNWHSCQIRIYNKSTTKTADDVRVELVSFDDELKMTPQATFFHPTFPVVLNPEIGSNTINPGGKLPYRLFLISPNIRHEIITDGKIVGYEQKLTARFNPNDSVDKNTALFECKKPYRVKLEVTARDFLPCKVEFDLSFSDKGDRAKIFIRQSLIKVKNNSK